MARRKRKEEEGDWTPPDFDEVAYMRREIAGTWAAVSTIAWAVVGAIVAFLLYSVNGYLAFFAGIAIGFGLYFVLPLLGIRTESFKRRDWTGHGITYFFSWLAFWIILLNPPFGDFTDPSILGISASPYHAGYPGPLLCRELSAGRVSVPGSAVNDTVYILFRATDNVGIDPPGVRVTPQAQSSFNVTATPVGGKSPCQGHQNEDLPGGAYGATFPASTSVFQVAISATDPSGRGASVSFTVTVT